MAELIKFRPHHFMCSLGFSGKGYSADFVRNYKKITKALEGNEETLIQVVEKMDDICSPCPNKINETICKTQAKIIKLDAAHSDTLNLIPGEIISWKQAKIRIKHNMSIEKFLLNCQDCSWQKYGICQKALEKLIKSN